MCVCVCVGGGGYSEFCLLHRLGLFLGFKFSILLFFEVWEKSGHFVFRIGHLQVFLGTHYQN